MVLLVTNGGSEGSKGLRNQGGYSLLSISCITGTHNPTLENPRVSPGTRHRAEVKRARSLLEDNMCEREKRRKQEGKLSVHDADSTPAKGKEGRSIEQGEPQTVTQGWQGLS